MRKTLLLVFIHGFKGGDDTFGTFPEHLRALVSHALPKVNVVAVQYPQFETRGELKDCVARLREWLENKVIDMEVENSTPSPTVDPSVHVILVGHSMGGIVAAETLLLLANEKPIRPSSSNNSTNPPEPNAPSEDASKVNTGHTQQRSTSPNNGSTSPLFPHVQAIVAFDTPYLGLAPEMVAHGLEGGHKMATNAWETANEVAGIFGWGSKTAPGASQAASTTKSVGALPAPPTAATNPSVDAAAAPRWQSWGKVAMFAGAAGAVAAGGAAALYSQREKISAGWTWASSHLLFVGDLAKAEILKRRVEAMERVVQKRGLGGCGNFYTNLGRGAREGYGITESVGGKDRTFCNLPKVVKDRNNEIARKGETEGSIDASNQDEKGKLRWMKAINEKAKDETSAHMSMFYPRDNPGFYTLGEQAKETISSWVDQSWYQSSDGAGPSGEFTLAEEVKGDWEGLEKQDIHADDNDLEMRDEDKENEGELEDSVVIETRSADGSGHLGRSDTNSSAKKTEQNAYVV